MRAGLLRGSLIALGLAAGLPAQITVLRSETITCCEGGFSLNAVVQRSQEEIRKLGLVARGAIRFVSIIPTERTLPFSIGGGSGDYPRDRCWQVARRIRTASSHAVLAVSPLGATVSYWDADAQRSATRPLQGQDIFREQIDGVRIAWIDQGGLGLPAVYLVVNRSIPREGYARLARSTMDRLGIERAEVLLRADPHHWMDRCSPASMPLQWVPPFLADPPGISPETAVCRVDTARPGPDCRLFRSH